MKTYKSKTSVWFAAVALLTTALFNQAFAENTIGITTDEEFLSIHADQRPLLVYRYKNVPFKPYVRQLFSPTGVNILRDAPADHLHHHALMFAVKVDGVNFWEETPAAGKQIHQSFTDVKADTKTDVKNDKLFETRQAGFTEHIHWTNTRRELLLKERRIIEVRQGTDLSATLLTWQSKFELPDEKESATLTGAHYHGLGMRFLKSMDAGGRFINADNKTGTVFRGEERLLRSTWCAYSANADGKIVTVAIFDHPQNPRHPATWFTMTAPFAYLSATLNLYKEPLKIASGKPLVLRYAVAVWDGRVELNQIEQLYHRWVVWPLDATPPRSANAHKMRTLATEDARESIAVLEQKIVAAAEKASHSVVRITWFNNRVKVEESRSGVIFNADGYVATDSYDPTFLMHDLPPGKAVAIHLTDGRCVPGVAVGSSRLWGFGLIKITQPGSWPLAEIGRPEEVKPGEICLALAYAEATMAGQLPYDQEPSLRVGHVVAKAEKRWLGTSCRIDGSTNRGGGLFDLQGRLVGIHAFPEKQVAVHPTVDVIKQHWKEVAGCKSAAERAAFGQYQGTEQPFKKNESPPLPSPDEPSLAPAVVKAKQVTVRIDERVKDESGFSGVLVTSDGYVATCAHHNLPRGTNITIRFADGRAVPGKMLGRDLLLDVGLAKITRPGPWPHAPWGSAAAVERGDLCLALGYPVHLQRKGRPHLEVRVGRITETWAAPAQLDSSCQTSGGDSGGGLFDSKGRLIAVHSGGAHMIPTWHKASDLFKRHWEFLVSGASLSEPVPFDRSPTAEAFRKVVEHVPSITVEVLGDQKRRALGTIVSSDGYILTKASELYGDISCQLADGRTFPATVYNMSREHDLALLKIDTAGLPQIPWSRCEQVPVGSFVGALRCCGEPPVVGVVALATHSVPRQPGWLVLGQVKDAKDGVEVVELWGIWRSDMPLHKGDVIVHVEGHPTPNVETFERFTKRVRSHWEVPSVIAGDPIRVGVKRDGKDMELRFPLLSLIWDQRGRTSPRSCAFPAVFDTDVTITPDTCGGPVVDRSGEVVGITIALPTEYRVYIVPAPVARKVFNQLRQ